jgi:hypothetical protein
MTATVICLAIICSIVILVLGITIYNQMLLLNQVNKRLLLMAKESIEKERLTMEEYQATIDSFESDNATTTPVTFTPEDSSTAFDPHAYTEEHDL